MVRPIGQAAPIDPLGRIFPATPGANVSKRNGTFAVLSANV